MKKNTGPVQPEIYYHIYNRGIDGETLFKQPRNYPYFLKQYAKYISPIADTYAYVLMDNHFHILVRIKDEATIRERLADGTLGVENKVTMAAKTVEQIISNQFAKFFNSYAQSINNQEKPNGKFRTGDLLEDTFRRIPILTQDYLMYMVYYIHFNPQKHGFTNDFTTYPYSSFQSFFSAGNTRLLRDEILSWFGGVDEFKAYHNLPPNYEGWENDIMIEVD